MTVSPIETFDGAIASSGSAVLTVTTTLAPTDRLAVLLFKAATTGTPTVTGLGTWTVLASQTLGRDIYLFTATNITGGGNVTISPGASPADYVMYVLRGSGSGQVDVFGAEDAFASSGVSASTASIAGALSGMFVASAGSVSPSLIATFPGSTMLPTTGWTTSRTGVNAVGGFIHQTLAADSTVRGGITSSGSGFSEVVVGVFAEAATTPPLTSTFTGWGNPIF